MKQSFALLFSAILLGSVLSAAPLSGTKKIGPTGDYTSIGAAIIDIQGQGLGGPLVLELQADYVSNVETFPLILPSLNGATIIKRVTVRPAIGATNLSITSADSTIATIALNGTHFLIIDGRPGGLGTAKELTIANTSASGVALRFINEASSNTIQYTTLRGRNTSATSGVVVFSTTTGAGGNDDNLIDHCDIRDGTGTPANGLYSHGSTGTTAMNNSSNTVSNCSIFNFYSGAADVAGVRLDNGNTDWTITGNSFYQTTTRTAVSALVHPIFINNTTGDNYFTVTDNFIGGTAPGAGGAAWTTTGTTSQYRFVGIRLSNVGTTMPISVQGNTIANFVWTSASPLAALPGVWDGIHVQAGSANIGTVMGNTIGSGTGTGSVSVTTSGNGGASFGIGSSSSDTVVIANNTIGSITVNGSTTSVSASLTGIQVTAGANTLSNNTVGSTTTANSLNATTSSTSATGQQVTGILSSSSISASITNSTVSNLNNNYAGTSTTGQIRGIVASAGVNTITGNTVRNLSTTSQNTDSTTAQSVFGITVVSTAGGQDVSQNTVHSLANSATSGGGGVTGIYFAGSTSGTNVIARNLVHSHTVSSTSAAAQLYGMLFGTGTFTAQNNVVRVGLKADGTNTAGAAGAVKGIFDNGTTAGRNFYHNSVYLGGTHTLSNARPAAFHSIGGSNARTFLNNIFVNARSHSGSGKSYAVFYNNPGLTGLAAGGNLFFATGTGGVLGSYYSTDCTTLAAWQAATGRDATSAEADPRFVNPAGTAVTVDLHLQSSNPAEGQGIPLASVTDDFDGQARSPLTPVDIGADAGNFSWIDGSAPGLSYTLLSDTLSLENRLLPGFATITDNVGVSGGVKSPRLFFKKSTDADAFNVPNNSTGNGWKHVTTENATSPYDFTVDYSLLNDGGVTHGDTIQYFVIAQDEANNFVSNPLGAASSGNPPVQNVSAKPGSVNSYRAGDFTAPVISHPLLTSGSTTNRVLTGWATITDDAGVAGGASAPRLYFKKNTDADAFGLANDSTGNGWKYVTATGSGPYNFTIDYALINGGSIAMGDTIQYFVVAQDAANNLASSPAGATASANPSVQNVNGHGTVNSFSIIPGISGTVTVGSGGTYPSLSGAGGLFAALNGAVLTGNVVVNITSDVTEDGSVTLNQWLEEGAGNYTLTLQPDSATMRTISGSVNSGLITLSGADRVTIDGRFGGSGRYLTFRNMDTGPDASTLLFINDASSNTVRNCVVEGATLNRAVILFSTGTVTGNDNNLITGCQIRDLTIAVGVPSALIGSSGSFGAEPNSDNTIANNELFNFDSVAIYVSDGSWTISGNNIYEVNAATRDTYGIFMLGGTNVITANYIHDLLTSSGLSCGIYCSSDNSTTTIARNRITALDVNAATTFVFGIFTQSGSGTLNVVNNQITLSPATSGSTTLYGMFDDCASTVNVYYNSIVLGGTESGTSSSWASLRRTASTHTVRDNIFLNLRTGGSASHFAVGNEGGSSSYTASHNLYAGSGSGDSANFMDFSTTGSTVPMSFATWQSSTGDTASQAGLAGSGSFTSTLFVDATNGDLHLVPGGNPLVSNTGTPVAGVTTDYDDETRGLVAPDIGADELISTNANLSGLALSSGLLSPVFDPNTTSYTAVVSNATATLIVTPTKAEPNAVATVNGDSPATPVVLNVGANPIAVLVTAQNPSSTKPYTVTVTRRTVFQDWAAANSVSNDPLVLGANGVANLLNFAFGVDPGSNFSGGLRFTGDFTNGGVVTATGLPITRLESTTDLRALFVRRADYVSAGLTYTVEFSGELATWQDSTDTPDVLANDGTHQIVSVPFPGELSTAGFFRVRVTSP